MKSENIPSYDEMKPIMEMFNQLSNHNEETIYDWFKSLTQREIFVVAWFGKGDLFGYGDGI